MKPLFPSLLVVSLCLAAATAQTLSRRYPITAEAVAQALHRDGFNLRAEDVRLPAQLSTTSSDPSFELIGADRLPDGHLRIRMRCRPAGECLPFQATLTPQPGTPQLVAAATPAHTALPPTLPTLATTQILSTPERPPATARVLSPGTKLTLLLDEGHMHIHLPVITLDRAAGGEAIRVATADHKHIYRATLLDEKTARGIIE